MKSAAPLLSPSTLRSPFEVKKLSSSGEFTGYASTYHVDTQQDQMMPGAFGHTLKEWKKRGKLPLLLWHHRIDEPIGFWKKMLEDDHGLYVEGQLIMDLQRAREAYMLMKTKILEGLSIGFQAIVSKRDPHDRVRKIYQVNLLEVSIVTLPANESAHVHSLKNNFLGLPNSLVWM